MHLEPTRAIPQPPTNNMLTKGGIVLCGTFRSALNPIGSNHRSTSVGSSNKELPLRNYRRT